MKCPDCNSIMKEIEVSIEGAKSKVLSYQCGKCGYFEFEDSSINKAINEIKLKETALKIKPSYLRKLKRIQKEGKYIGPFTSIEELDKYTRSSEKENK